MPLWLSCRRPWNLITRISKTFDRINTNLRTTDYVEIFEIQMTSLGQAVWPRHVDKVWRLRALFVSFPVSRARVWSSSNGADCTNTYYGSNDAELPGCTLWRPRWFRSHFLKKSLLIYAWLLGLTRNPRATPSNKWLDANPVVKLSQIPPDS